MLKWHSPILFSFLFLATAAIASGQDTLRVGPDFKNIKPGSFIRYFKTNKTIPVDSAAVVFENTLTEIKKLEQSHLGIGTDNFWFSLIVKNQSKEDKRLMLELNHSHLTRVSFFEKSDLDFKNRGTMGMLYPFNNRPVKHRHFLMPISLAAGASVQVFVLIAQENSLDTPFVLWDEAAFYKHDYDINLLFGVFFGILIFGSLLALICFAMVRQKVFMWYFLYVVTACIYVFQEIGAAFQYIYPSMVYVDAPLSIQLPVFMFIFIMLFSQSLLYTEADHKTVHRILNYLVIFFLGLIFLGLTVNGFMRSISLWLLPLIFFTMLGGHLVLIYTGVQSLKSRPTTALLYLAATGSVILSGMYNILAHSVGFFATDVNPLFVGILIEVLLLSSALILQYDESQRERARLKNELIESNNKMFQQHIVSIEKERNRIAADLHDHIGSELSNIKRAFFKNETDEGAKRINSLIDDVRHLSHDLAPTIAKVSGLLPLIEKSISEITKTSGTDIKLQVFDFKEALPTESVVQVYRIVQEALHNILLHSTATHADIQFFGYDNEIVVTIEDDGVGFDPATQSGFGINSMRARATLLKGRIEINSTPGKGCMIVVEIPIGAEC